MMVYNTLTYMCLLLVLYECICECKLNVCVDNELVELSAELLAEANGDVCILYPFMKERECEWYMYVMCYIHSWRKGSVNGIRMFMISIHSWRNGSVNGVRMLLLSIHSCGRRGEYIHLCDCVPSCVVGEIYKCFVICMAASHVIR